jgi:hypothetical protein
MDTLGMPRQKNFRLNDELRTQFERHCRGHLLDERAVVEAWLLRFLESSDQERQATAKRYTEWLSKRKKEKDMSATQTGKRIQKTGQL